MPTQINPRLESPRNVNSSSFARDGEVVASMRGRYGVRKRGQSRDIQIERQSECGPPFIEHIYMLWRDIVRLSFLARVRAVR